MADLSLLDPSAGFEKIVYTNMFLVQWLKHPEPASWISVLEHAHDGFFARERTNPYGEKWDGPALMPYNYWPEFV